MPLKQALPELLLSIFFTFSGAQQNVTLDGGAKVITLPAHGWVTLTERGILPDTAYIVCQAHVQKDLITLSLKPELLYASSVTGKNVGVVSVLDANTTDLAWYLYSNSSRELHALVHLTHYTANEPYPGGCNEEFQLQNDSNIHLKVQDTKTTVQFQHSNTGFQRGRFPSCDDTVYASYLEYHVYVRYIQGGDFGEQAFFDGLRHVLTAADTKKHATLLKQLTSRDKTRVDISSYKQQGVIYTVIVRDKQRGTQATYVPAVTYACDIDAQDDCKKRNVAAVIFSTIGALVGLFLCFFGHRFFKTENFVFGFLLFSLLFYQVIALETSISDAGTYALAAILGLIGGALLLAFWWYKGVPVLSVLLISLVAGYLIASILFYTPFGGVLLLAFWWYKGVPVLSVLLISMVAGYLIASILFYTPFANISYWSAAYNYGVVFACAILIVPVILLFFTRFLNIFSCALVGSYLVIVAMDTYLLGGMRYIVLNSLRHGTDRSYIKVVVSGPFTQDEIGLMIVWLLLFISAIAFQLFHERKKAPFPPCPRHLYDRSADLRRLLKPDSTPGTNRARVLGSADREPLLQGNNRDIRQYGAVSSQRAVINGDSHLAGSDDGEEETEEEINNSLPAKF